MFILIVLLVCLLGLFEGWIWLLIVVGWWYLFGGLVTRLLSTLFAVFVWWVLWRFSYACVGFVGLCCLYACLVWFAVYFVDYVRVVASGCCLSCDCLFDLIWYWFGLACLRVLDCLLICVFRL